ncbi:hypothetical protein BZG36_05570, partial [Bifiguratus adelaidae]
MGYAKVANLPPQYGLYSSFVGVCIYCLFATSKDITIGPTAVMSLLVGQIITSVTTTHPEFTGPQIAACLSLIAGAIAMALGVLRLGFIVEFIPNPAIAGFMTGSAITIAIGQIAGLMGIPNINTRASSYYVLGTSLAGLPNTHLDAAFGLVGLFILYTVRFAAGRLTKRYPKYERAIFFVNISRNGLLVIFSTLIAWGITRGQSTSPISILKTVPAGFQAMQVPDVPVSLLSQVTGNIPVVTLILIMEHIAIAKSFGRINDYKINPSQEIIAIGITNIIASFFTAYPSTGSFSRTAIKARSVVRTPLAGIFSGIVVVLALYALTPAFYYIPSATLSAVIIHAVGDLITSPRTLKLLWRVNPLELFIFIVSVLISFFVTLEVGIYVSVCLAIVILLFRLAHPRTEVLGRVKVQDNSSTPDRYIYAPLNQRSLQNVIEAPPPGVVIFRLDESLTYPNANYVSDKIIDYVKSNTRKGAVRSTKKGDRAWNDARKDEYTDEHLPVLKALVLDCAGVNVIDCTGIQALIDARVALERYADRTVHWHFANITNRSIKRTLTAAGFGGNTPSRTSEIAPVIPPHRDGPQTLYTEDGDRIESSDAEPDLEAGEGKPKVDWAESTDGDEKLSDTNSPALSVLVVLAALLLALSPEMVRTWNEGGLAVGSGAARLSQFTSIWHRGKVEIPQQQQHVLVIEGMKCDACANRIK